MINVYEKKNGAVRRSFVLPAEIVQALEQIQIAQGFENISEALRYSVVYTYDRLSQAEPHPQNDRMMKFLFENHTLLKFLLIEIVKAHGGRDWNESEQLYVKKLNKHIKSYLKEREDDP